MFKRLKRNLVEPTLKTVDMCMRDDENKLLVIRDVWTF